jgi:citrate lyase beta subunit
MNLDFKGSEILVRLNPLQSGMIEKDLEAIIKGRPGGIILPKIEDERAIQMISGMISEYEKKNGWIPDEIRLVAICESALAITNLKEICNADRRLDTVIFGGEDLAADLGVDRTKDARELFLARGMVVLQAAAAQIQAIDLVCTDFRDMELVRAEAEEGAGMGFSGKQVIHPNQVDVVQKAFSPSDEEIQKALKIVGAFKENESQGKGAFALDGKMVDLPVVKRAQNVLLRAGIKWEAT